MKKLTRSMMPKRLKLPKGAAKPPPKKRGRPPTTPLSPVVAVAFKKRGGIKPYLKHVASSQANTDHYYNNVYPRLLDHQVTTPADGVHHSNSSSVAADGKNPDGHLHQSDVMASVERKLFELIRAQQHDEAEAAKRNDALLIDVTPNAISAPVTESRSSEPLADSTGFTRNPVEEQPAVLMKSAAAKSRGAENPDFSEPLARPVAPDPPPAPNPPPSLSRAPPQHERPGAVPSRSVPSAPPNVYAGIVIANGGSATPDGRELNSTEKFLLWGGHSGTGWRI